MKEEIYFDSQGYKLAGTLCKANPEKGAILFIQGGGNIPRKDGPYVRWQEFLVERGITSFNFDFRGVGEAEGELSSSSLNSRLIDTVSALSVLKDSCRSENIYLAGASMGGPIAIRLTDSSIKGLILLAPAAYSMEARDKNFGPAFSEAIRKPESWKDSPDFEDLKKYDGKTFLFYGDKDEVIPHEILETYAEIVRSKGGEVVVMKEGTHKSWKEAERIEVLNKMAQFIIGSNERRDSEVL